MDTKRSEELVLDGRRAELAKRLAYAELDQGEGAEWEMAVIRTAIEFAADNVTYDPLHGWTFCTDDVRPLLPDVHPNRIGRAFALMAEAGKIEVVGTRKSRVVSSHSRRVLTYRKPVVPETVIERPDDLVQDPYCLERNPDDAEYTSGCCRFPKSCSPYIRRDMLAMRESVAESLP